MYPATTDEPRDDPGDRPTEDRDERERADPAERDDRADDKQRDGVGDEVPPAGVQKRGEEYADEAVGWTGRRESVSIRILPPIETEGLTAEDIPELIERCHRKMSETIATL